MQIPQALLKSLAAVKDFDENLFLQAHTYTPITSIRRNPSKNCTLTDSVRAVPWCTNGFYLAQRPEFVFDPLWHAGTYYVQEASSMFLEQAVTQHADLNTSIKVLDLCAAPGGKSTHLASMLSEDSLLVSNEVIGSRVNILAENISKWGQLNTWVTSNDPSTFKHLEHYFDVLVVDAPCSGSGLFRKDEQAINEWSENNVKLCAERQKRILSDAIHCLKPNGLLVYMTCSYSPQENEDLCDFVVEQLNMESLRISTNDLWGIVETCSDKHKALGYRFFPHKLNGEGFFLAVFRNMAKEENKKKATHKTTVFHKEKLTLPEWVSTSSPISFIEHHKNVFAIHANHQNDLQTISRCTKLIKKGIHVGETNFKNFTPSHELAMSTIYNNHLARVEINKTDAIKYLSKIDFPLSERIQKGWVLLTYNHVNLGWVKNIGSRYNNYYPTNWRIRKAYNV